MVSSLVESPTVPLVASGWLFGRESDSVLDCECLALDRDSDSGSEVVGSLGESQTAALVVSGWLFGRESDSGSGCKWLALWKRVRQQL